MEFVDEQIAMIEREKRRQDREELLAAGRVDVDENVCRMSLEEALQGVREGSLLLPGNERFEFEVRYYFDDKIPAVVIRNFYTGVQEDKDVVFLVNHDQNISQVLTVSDKKMERQSIGKWKKQLETGMNAAGSYADITKEAVLENLDYLIYRTPTGKGWTYNLIFRIRTGSERIVGNYNCFEKDKDTYGLMLEALVHRLNELLAVPAEEKAKGE
ncbi:MAG: hypothetical protein J1F42_12050 [Lachnospiraceae bacterium]|nr:hypothetical protein [Lachnospiraceae bacterium]